MANLDAIETALIDGIHHVIGQVRASEPAPETAYAADLQAVGLPANVTSTLESFLRELYSHAQAAAQAQASSTQAQAQADPAQDAHGE